jgi:hypothetical protein
MGKSQQPYDPLEQWKEDYNRGGAASLETLGRLAHMSRFLAGYQQRSADAHLVLFALTRDVAYLHLAIQVAASRSAAGRLADAAGPQDWIDTAVPLFSSALRRAEPGTRWYAALQRGQAIVLYSRAAAASRTDYWRLAVRALVKLLAASSPGEPDRSAFTASLANARRELAHLTDNRKTLATAFADFEEAVASFPPEEQGYAELVLDAARTAAELATGASGPRWSGRALALYEQAAASDAELAAAAADDVARLAYFFLEQWRERHRAGDMERSAEGWRAAARLSRDDADRLTQNLNNLVGTLQEAREHRDRPGLLDEQLATLERLVELVPDSAPARGQYLVGLAMSYRDRFRSGHERADIDAAIDRLTRAVDRTAPAQRRSLTIELGGIMRERHLWSGELPDIDASLAFWRGLLDATPVTDPDHAEWLGGVAGTLLDRYRQGRRAADLDAAVEAVDEALRAVAGRRIPAAYRQRLRELEALAVQERYREFGRAPDLERLISLSGEDLRESEPGSPERTARATEHAFLLFRRFDRDSDQGDLNEAIAVLEESAPATGSDADRARWLTLLGEGLLKRYGLWGMGQLDELARAREYLEGAVELTPAGTHARVDALLGLASATELLFQLAPIPVGDRDLPVRLLEQALDQAGTDPAYAPFVCRRLADSLLRRADSGRQQPADLDRAIELLERAASAGRGGFEAVGGQLELADALRERYQRSSRPRDRQHAIAKYRANLPPRLETNVDQVLGGAARWGVWAASRRSWAEAAEAFTLAVQALDEIYLANVGVGSTVWLRRAPGLAADAAYAFARAGRPADSALVLEAARFRAGSESLALVRADLARLAHGGYADLADRLHDSAARWRRESLIADASPPAAGEVTLSFSFSKLREAASRADEPEPHDATEQDPDGTSGARSGDVDRRAWGATGRMTRKARKDFEEAVLAIREVAGFERFLDEPTLSDITAISGRLPVVYLASCAQGGVAVAVRPDRPARALFLPALRRSLLDAEVSRFQEAYQGHEADPVRWRTQLAATTRWLWDAVMGRTLSLVDHPGQVLLIPAGTLGVLPLHAAWRPDARAPTGRRYACDRVVISYAPNARSAASAPGRNDDTLLAVADPAPLPASLQPLTFAEPEVAAAAAWFPAATVLQHEEATADRVRKALKAASVYHLACHGRVDLREPRRSALVLAAGQLLTLQHLLDLRLDEQSGGRLAILTACETALAGSVLPDEVISLPAALIQAGFTGAVATQWAVPGLPSAFLAARFYQHWKRDNWDWATSLAAAQRWLRDSTDGAKAEFVHPREGSPLLPITVRRPLWRAVAVRNPAGRSFADIADWGAYTYVGGTTAQAGADETGT